VTLAPLERLGTGAAGSAMLAEVLARVGADDALRQAWRPSTRMPERRTMLDDLLVHHLPLGQMRDRLDSLNAELTEKGRRLQALLDEIRAAERLSGQRRPWQLWSLAGRLGSLPKAPLPPRSRP
jgi:hypothetical protein